MPTVNEQLRDEQLHHAIELQRYTKNVAGKIVSLLDEANDDLLAKISESHEPSIKKARLEKMLSGIRSINRAAYRRAYGETRDELTEFAKVESAWQAATMANALPINVDFATPAVSTLAAVVSEKPFVGGLLGEWFEGLEQGAFNRTRGAIRLGIAEGESTEDIVRRIVGTSAMNYKDGVLDISRRSARTVVTTAAAHVSAQAREETFKANDDLIKDWQFIATLDLKTSEECRALDQTVWPVGEGPMPPRHPNCRSQAVGLTPTWRELGIDLDEAPEGTRASMDGQVPAELSYYEWLKTQSPEAVERVLGKEKAAQFLKGDLKVDRFVDYTGKTVTLDDLQARIPKSKQEPEAPPVPKPPKPAAPSRLRPEDLAGKTDFESPWHLASFNGADDLLRSVMKRRPPVRGYPPVKNASAFWHPAGAIHMASHALDDTFGQSIWRHEYGHHVDMIDREHPISAGASTTIAASGKAIESNVGQFDAAYERMAPKLRATASVAARREAVEGELKAAGLDITIKEIEALVGREVQDVAEIAAALIAKDARAFLARLSYSTEPEAQASLAALSDAVDASTLGKVGGHKMGLYGHSDAYYSASARVAGGPFTELHTAEIFAQWWTLRYSKSAAGRKVFDVFFPGLSRRFEELLK